MPEVEKARPAAEQIYRQLAREIAEGRYTLGQRVPSVRELAASWQVAPGTAARALGMLRSARLVTAGPRGTYVTAPARLVPGPQHRLALSLPPAGRVEVTGAAYLERAPDYVRPILGLQPVREDLWPVVRREEVHHGVDGHPVLLLVEWIPPELAEACPELAEPEPLPVPGGAIQLIAGRLPARATARGRGGAESRYPQLDDREIPLLRPGVAVLAVVWTWFDTAGDPLVYSEMAVRQDKVIEFEFGVS